MIKILVPVYDPYEVVKLFNCESYDQLIAAYKDHIQFQLLDDSGICVDWNALLGDKLTKFRIKKNPENIGTLRSRISLINDLSDHDIAFIADSDDFLIPVKIDALSNKIGIIQCYTTAYYHCDEKVMTKDEYYVNDFHPIRTSIGRAACFSGSLWNAYVLKWCIKDLQESNLLPLLYDICGTDKICIQEDEFLWMWCKDWMYNNKISYGVTWEVTSYYNAFNNKKSYQLSEEGRIDYNSEVLTKQREEWKKVLKSYFKY